DGELMFDASKLEAVAKASEGAYFLSSHMAPPSHERGWITQSVVLEIGRKTNGGVPKVGLLGIDVRAIDNWSFNMEHPRSQLQKFVRSMPKEFGTDVIVLLSYGPESEALK